MHLWTLETKEMQTTKTHPVILFTDQHVFKIGDRKFDADLANAHQHTPPAYKHRENVDTRQWSSTSQLKLGSAAETTQPCSW